MHINRTYSISYVFIHSCFALQKHVLSKSVIIPILLYGCEIWTLLANMEREFRHLRTNKRVA